MRDGWCNPVAASLDPLPDGLAITNVSVAGLTGKNFRSQRGAIEEG